MRYDKLLRARKRREKSLQMQTARLEAAAEEVNCHCRNLRGLWKKAAEQLREQIRESGGGADATVRLRERNLTEHRKKGHRRYRRVNEKLEQVRNRLRDAVRSRRLLEKLRKRERHRTRRRRRLQEQKNLDTFSAQRYWKRAERR